ncbi:hypothetical protein A0H81_09638 [Grifola frondosa]|uniref:Uncharacterized protein n=1 Tax=Grifola frondosa TaxID=5627 RepID=A0A1C7M0W2_GRIFR|nr:hypothetical protein A0H81_09638 [Grifola frondosa]
MLGRHSVGFPSQSNFYAHLPELSGRLVELSADHLSFSGRNDADAGDTKYSTPDSLALSHIQSSFALYAGLRHCALTERADSGRTGNQVTSGRLEGSSTQLTTACTPTFCKHFELFDI